MEFWLTKNEVSTTPVTTCRCQRMLFMLLLFRIGPTVITWTSKGASSRRRVSLRRFAAALLVL
jgi:hypothetical protein